MSSIYLQSFVRELLNYNARGDFDSIAKEILPIVNSKFTVHMDKADKKSETTGSKAEYLEKSTQTITRAFSACLNDRQNQATSFIWGVYGVANELFCVYLKLKKLNLYKSIIRSLQAAGLPQVEEFPISQQITFHYYLGRYEFFNEDFAKSKVHLNSAFKMCPAHYAPQRRRILTYLLPVMLQTGRLPKPKLLDQFPQLSAIYRPIVSAVHQGYLVGVEKAIEANERYLLDKGVYLILEKTKDLACRELIRNTYKIVGGESRLDMTHTHRAFNISSEKELDYNQVECQVAVLIYKKLIMGYISHERRVIVLSKVDPFPSLGGMQT
ncbi:COP9 signalosome (CSN) subunit [Entomophthora muscae]|uniref:COP9 signalosome (CSN) subunit n=1 Tax=Entomophthora muscae TaxID=34485 RepID=A0ACC2T6A2_9FUNG|nr:COP9 signalosome (CSN) subunit [Entomophthora muscae]